MGYPTRIIIGTADVQQATKEQALAGGAFAVVHKPFVPGVLRRVVNEALADLQQGK